jgi:hypothetical protein
MISYFHFPVAGIPFRLEVTETGFILHNEQDNATLLDASQIADTGTFCISRALEQPSISINGTQHHNGLDFVITRKDNPS